jgi:hypothetical protein
MLVQFLRILPLAAMPFIAGCLTLPGAGGAKEAPELTRGRMAGIASNGGVAAIGIGEAWKISSATEKARKQATKEAARMARARLDTIRRSFMVETGEGKDSGCDAIFESAARYLEDEVLADAAPASVEFSTREGTTTAYAVMEVSPVAIVTALEAAGQSNRSLHSRLTASKAFASLTEEARKYAELKRQRAI